MLLTKEVSIVIYGAGEVGTLCAQALLSKGYHVIAALDQSRENENLIEEIPIFRFGNEGFSNKEKHELIVIICLADGMLHKKVADVLYQNGYNYIVFLPMCHSLAPKRKTELTELYNQVLVASERLEDSLYEVRDYECYAFPELCASNGIISEDSESYTVYIGMELLFTESIELWEGDKTKFFAKEEYKDKNIAAQYRNENLWDFFASRTDSCEEYFKGFYKEKTSEERLKELKKREALYKVFQSEYDRGWDFFVQAAPFVKRNSKHYFNLMGGHNRTTFLLSKGHTFFPVRMQKQEFELWNNEEDFEILKQFLKERKIKNTYAPIPHPGMMLFPCECGTYGKNKLKNILKFFGLRNMHQYRVLDIGDDEGYFARNMLHCGVIKAEYKTKDVQELELARKINSLLYLNDMEMEAIDSYQEITELYDIVFAIKIDDTISIKELSKITVNYLFVELCSDDEACLLADMNFNSYEVLYEEYRDGRIWKTIVYKK